jgi:universal stress protein family protein
MSCKYLLAISDRPCAQAALRTLESLAVPPEGLLVVVGLVQAFQMVYAHKHPLIGRRIRNFQSQLRCEQIDELERVLRETETNFRLCGWNVRTEIREGELAEEILTCCLNHCPQLLIVDSCLKATWPFWSSGKIWQRVVREAPCPVLVIKHSTPDATLAAAEWYTMEGECSDFATEARGWGTDPGDNKTLSQKKER